MICINRHGNSCSNTKVFAPPGVVTDAMCALCPLFNLTHQQSVDLLSRPHVVAVSRSRYRHFARAILRAVWWTVRNRRLPWLVGRAYRARLEVCRSNRCGKYHDGRCTSCGCNTASGNRVLDKARWPAETCPVGMWPE